MPVKRIGDLETPGTAPVPAGPVQTIPAPKTNLVDPTPQTQTPAATQQEAPRPLQPMGAGTGFVNLDRVLGANTGAGQAVTDAGSKALGAKRSGFDSQMNDYGTGLQTAKSKGVFETGELSTQQAGDLANTGDTDKLKKSITGLDYGDFGAKDDPANSQRINALSNSKSAGRQLATDAGLSSQYGGKLSAIDAAIYGSAPNVGAVNNNAAQNTAETTRQSDATTKTNANTADWRNVANEKVANNRSTLRSVAQGTIDAAAANAATVNARDAGLGVPNANASNFISGNSLSNIAGVLGDDSLNVKAGPAYDPSAAAGVIASRQQQATADAAAARKQEAQDALAQAGMDPQQWLAYVDDQYSKERASAFGGSGVGAEQRTNQEQKENAAKRAAVYEKYKDVLGDAPATDWNAETGKYNQAKKERGTTASNNIMNAVLNRFGG